ncbi:Ribosomal RNA small subunit methyltransferase B [Achromobacter animicus]|uniref:Ribosomal RNA small subunit methyltransferase B n=2 Tax=Achromobacter animicus TaxID=1389935 RepID=A0A6S7A3F6_9BURK|nr:Ribosomal RNA small subunit methyltransferase B [Achromobacter animicus]CAB3877320.1 Ribosomal RNA small subunit methyltransferase B [Achromobacter animicus]
MTKPQSPRSRPAGSFGAASEGRDGRSFFSRPKGDARKPAPRDRAESGDRARDERTSDRGGYGQDRGEGRGRPDSRSSFGGQRNEGRGSERGSYSQDRREGQGRPDSRSSFGGQRGEGRGSYGQDRGEGRGSERGSYSQDRREGQGRPDSRSSFGGQRGEGRGSFGQERGEGRGGERGSYSQDRRGGQGRPDSRSSFGGQRGEGRGSFGQDRGESRGGERGSYSQDRREGQGRPDSRSSFGGQRGEGRGSYGQDRGGARGGERGSYGQDRSESRGGERNSYGQDRRDEQGRSDSRSSFGGPRGESRGGERDHAPQKPQSNRPRLSHAAIRIDQVQRVLGEILQWTYPADAALSHWLRHHPNLGARDRSEVAEAVYDVLRHLRRYRQYGESGVGPASRRLAILGLNATLGAEFLQEGMDAAEAEWLQRVTRIDVATLPRAVRGSIPDWLDERLSAMESPETLVEALNRQASLDLRVNPLKAERDAMLAELQQGAGRYEPTAMPFSPWGIRMEGRPAINRWPQFENGSIEVQDEGSQLLALLVAPRRGEMIIDFCAGAGGKTLLLGALMRSTGRLYAFDVSAARLARAKPRFARSGLSNVVPVVIDNENDARVKRLAGKAQRVLVDAPCSGIGTLRRNPDLKWRQHPEALAELGQLQERILNSAARCVAPGGRLVYATCSLLAEENEVQADRFLASHPDFERVDAAEILGARCESLKLEGPYVQLRPDLHGTDGFFAAVFERKKKGAGTDAAEAADANLADEDDRIDAADGAEAEAQAGADAQTDTAEETAVEEAEVKASDVKETETAVKDPA